jgi:DNA-binding response OmpR family regulator
MKTVLLVEPDYMLGDSYQKALTENFEVRVARSAQEAIDIIDSSPVDLIITDTLISENNGIEILYEIRSYEDWLNLPVILLSSLPVQDFPISPKDWIKYGISSFAYKPKTQPFELVAMAQSAVS